MICQHIPALLTETLSVAPTVQKQFGLPSKAHSHPQLPCTGLSMSGTLCKSRGFALLALILSLLSLIVEVVRLTVEVMEKIYQKKNDDNKKD